MDVEMPKRDGIEALRRIRAATFSCTRLSFTTRSSPDVSLSIRWTMPGRRIPLRSDSWFPQYASKAFQGTVNSVERYNPSNFYLETFAAYKFKAWGYDHRIQLNVKNLTKVPEYVGWYKESGESVATHRYEVPTKIIWNLGYTLEF